ncbi:MULTISPECIES: ABC transporter ATP-binding protein [unclassified Corynebacterium]|uniref:ABC transporter ATP-binding protein n=1 Tax=unclassified Corynebacterium TaxID=2624378 RepID=UPI0029CA1E32|nr:MULTISPECIES: ABC transporter ATP-binding protein [unclassified Corynebacterium]WPF65634.1 ABC transporter ATP-binding protein [Corynebacterium sp. 22KM0430]WPF68129.1 ABC transporter ATP-binding protein [Corynebacterium sp. 21KM1197]
MSALLSVRDLSVSYRSPRGGAPIPAVRGVSLDVHPGSMTCVVGESGSGKSTTALASMGLLPPQARIDAGSIRLDGREVTGYTEKQWRVLRGTTVGLVPQDPHNSLNPLKTIGASVAEPLAMRGRDTSGVIDLLAAVGIDDPARRARQYPHELSGGLKQRALIAAALALEPELLIADEPTSALDVTVQKIILDLLDSVRRERGIGILFITHDLAVAGDRADRVVVMQRGQVREEGLAVTVLTDPRSEYTRRLLADAPSLSSAPQEMVRAVSAVEPEEPPLLEVQRLEQRFGGVPAVRDVSFSVPRGSTHAIVGESGSGKTTTGRIIAGFQRPTAGSVRLGDTRVEGLGVRGLRGLRRRVQLVYQNPYSSLDPRRSVGYSVGEPLRNIGGLAPRGLRRKVEEYLDLVALDPALASRRPAELSGGQRQRVALARALIVEPELVVLDEAVSALDVSVQAQIIALLRRLQEELGLTYVFISHDLAVVRQIAHTVSVIHRGEQVEWGNTAEVFDHPASEYTQALLRAIPGQRYRDGALNLGL